MNLRPALGFFAVGAVCALLPRFAPGVCPFTAVDGSSTRMIWLQIMSTLLMGIGLSYFARRSLTGLASLLEYTPRPTFASSTSRAAQPVLVPRPALVARTLTPIREALNSGLIDQRRAA
ncbi:MAG: hypothetical protein ABIV50_08550 [Opitutus sp.]